MWVGHDGAGTHEQCRHGCPNSKNEGRRHHTAKNAVKNKECAVIRKQQTKTNKKKRWRKEGPRGEQASKARVCKWQQQNKRKATKRNETRGGDIEREREGERGGERAAKCIVAWK